jgi:hypothetical protein
LSWLRRHPAAAAALVYAALAVALYAPALVPGHTLSAADYLWSAAPWEPDRPPGVPVFGSNFELVDQAVQFAPWLEHTRERLPDAPLWNPYVGAGRPFLANAQSAVLSPFSVPAYVLPFWWSLGLIAVLKVFAAAFGTYLLGRALGMRFGGALLAGVVYAFSLYFVVWITWPHTNVWALLPWLLLMTEAVVRRPTALRTAGLATVVALQFFGGHPESNFHLLIATACFFVYRAIALRRAGELPALKGPLIAFGAGLVGGAALAAATLLPFLELLYRSNDVDVRQDFAQIALPRKYLLGFALPDYWGRGTHVAVEAYAQERALYVGALPLVLAAVAVAVRPRFERVAVALFALLVLAVALGVPPIPDIASRLPIVRTGNHLRVVVILMLCLALLAGWGLDELAARRLPRPRVLLGAAAGLLLLPALVLIARSQLSRGQLGEALEIAWGFAWPNPPAGTDTLTAIRMASLIEWLSFMGLALVLLALRVSGRLAATAFVALAVALVVADLFKAGMGATPAIAKDDATQPSAPAIEYLRARGLERFVGLGRAVGPSPLIPNVAMRWSLYDARSYDLPVERRYDKLWRRAILDGAPTDTPTTSAKLTEQALPAFRLLSVTRVLQDPLERPVERPALPTVYNRPDMRIYANPRALPRAGVVDAQQVAATDDEQLAAVLAAGFDGRRTVVTPTPLPGLGSSPGPGSAGSARIVRYEPERVVIDATARRPSELVLTDLHYPGWKATIDGRPADVHRVDYLLRGTSLPEGRHRVEFRYEPTSWRIGWIVSLLALAGLIAVLALEGRRARRRRAVGVAR